MAGKIRARDIEEVKSRVNIADVVGEYVALKNASVGSLKGLCPFHDEKSAVARVATSTSFCSKWNRSVFTKPLKSWRLE